MVRKAWTNGIQGTEALAGLFKVSRDAMTKRLKYLHFVDDEPDRAVHTYFRSQSPALIADAQIAGYVGELEAA